MSKVARVLATWFGCGYFPVGPGTAGSLAAVMIAFLVHLPPPWIGALALVLLPIAIWSAGVVAREEQVADPQIVVIDEVVGQWITLAGATRLNWPSWLAAFLLFRLFDIWKPQPVRQLERLHGGAGIVLDDAMAGIYGALVLFLLGCFNLY